MIQKRLGVALVTVVVCLLLSACASLSGDHIAALTEFANEKLRSGAWTQDQYDAFIDGIRGGREWLRVALQSIIDIGLTLLGVRVWRGGINERRGNFAPLGNGNSTTP